MGIRGHSTDYYGTLSCSGSGNVYRGVNALYLSVAQTAKGYRDNRWATATQIQALGGQVRPGEQATPRPG